MNYEYDYEDTELERYEQTEPPRYRFEVSRRAFVQTVGTGILITWAGGLTFAQGRRRSEAGSSETHPITRFHIGKDGRITAGTSKVEMGQGARTQITQAVAEELRVPIESVDLIMADTAVVPNDGPSHGSRTTPQTIPRVRQAAASAREALIQAACEHWKVSTSNARMEDGRVISGNGKVITLGELASELSDVNGVIAQETENAAQETPYGEWSVLGESPLKPTSRAIVTGAHQYPSDIRRPGMLYGKVLRPPMIDAELEAVDLAPANNMDGVFAMQDGNFVACAAPTSFQAQQAVDAVAKTAKWKEGARHSSSNIYRHLKETAQDSSSRGRYSDRETGDVEAALKSAAKVVSESYGIPYIQHAPMEPRAAVAEWNDGHVTVWCGSQQPFGMQRSLSSALNVEREHVRIIVPDMGGGFGGKQRPDACLEAARLAKEAGKPVAVFWTREEEFAWAYCRPAGLMEASAGLDKDGEIVAWDFTNYNAGGSALECPYDFPNKRTKVRRCDSPLSQGSYRALASTANNFARETFVDSLVDAANRDPYQYRMDHLEDERMRGVLEAAAKKFEWSKKFGNEPVNTAYGIACGTEKGSVVATCAEVRVDPRSKRYEIRDVCVAFECGAIHNPKNLQNQVEGCVVMGIGAILGEEMVFENGELKTTNFKQYDVPRFKHVPPIEVVLVNRPDLQSVGAGETPIIAIAPAVASAVARATGKPVTRLPIKIA